MQPQDNSNYDFILKEPAAARKKLPLPQLPKLAWGIIIASFGVLLLVVVMALLSGGKKTNTNIYIDTLARGEEIIRAVSYTHLTLPTT